MEPKNFNLEFNGYWLEANRQSVPNVSGIYCVYACVYYPDRDTVGLNDLLYIGESNNVGQCINDHESKQNWIDFLVNHQLGQTLCYSFTKNVEIDNDSNRKLAKTALIIEHKPPLNSEAEKVIQIKESVNITTMGMNSHLKNKFSLNV